jgi:hypothetical protein
MENKKEYFVILDNHFREEIKWAADQVFYDYIISSQIDSGN